jgi:hypothetical protein
MNENDEMLVFDLGNGFISEDVSGWVATDSVANTHENGCIEVQQIPFDSEVMSS